MVRARLAPGVRRRAIGGGDNGGTGLQHQVLERMDGPGRSAIAFRLSGRHTGPLQAPLGDVPASGRVLGALGLDILISEDRVTGVWAVADWLGLLVQAQAITLAAP